MAGSLTVPAEAGEISEWETPAPMALAQSLPQCSVALQEGPCECARRWQHIPLTPRQQAMPSVANPANKGAAKPILKTASRRRARRRIGTALRTVALL